MTAKWQDVVFQFAIYNHPPAQYGTLAAPPLARPKSLITTVVGNTPTAAAKLGSQSDADLLTHQHAHREQYDPQVQYESASATPTWATSLSHGHAERRRSEPRIRAHPDNESLASFRSGRRQSAITYSDLALRRSSVPLESGAAAASRYVDLLDAQGQLGPSDFKARLQASGSREYGEDVAERNMGQNGLLLGSPAVQQFYAAQSQATSPRRPTSRYRRYAPKHVILEQPEMEAAGALRPSSRASSVYTARSLPAARTRGVAPIFDSPIYTAPSSSSSSSSMGLPRLQEGRILEEVDSEESDNAAFPPSIPRFRRSEADANAAPQQQQQRPASALGWVSRARQSVDVLSAYDIGEPAWKDAVDHAFQDDGAGRRPATRGLKSNPAAQQQNLSVENMIRWRRTFGEVDDEDQRSVATERATESRTSQRQWSIASTEPTERSDVSSVYCPRPASRATANTSVDLRSLMELDDGGNGGGGCCCKASHDVVDDDIDACSMTTDGSNVDAFVEKRKHRAVPEDQALLFNEGGFFNTGGALPGLFDPSSPSSSSDGVTPLAEPPAAAEQVVAAAASSDGKRDSSQTLRADAPATHKTAGSPKTTEFAPQDCRCSSVATPEPVTSLTVPQIYLNQRQRLLALGFDYDTDEDGDELGDLGSGNDNDDDDDDAKTLRQRHGSMLSPPRLSIIVEAPPKDMYDSSSSSSSGGGGSGDDSVAAAAALRRRMEAKRLSRCGGGSRVMRVHRSLRDEFDGNVADVE